MRIRRFEDLGVWKLSLKITKEIYDITAKGSFVRDFGLKDQIRRSIVSVSSNIVEGFEKGGTNEFIRYLRIARGSAGEARNQIYIAFAVGHIAEEEFRRINEQLLSLSDQLGRFISYLITHNRSKKKKR